MFVFRKKRDCSIYVAKTKALISFAVTAKLSCVFVSQITIFLQTVCMAIETLVVLVFKLMNVTTEHKSVAVHAPILKNKVSCFCIKISLALLL